VISISGTNIHRILYRSGVYLVALRRIFFFFFCKEMLNLSKDINTIKIINLNFLKILRIFLDENRAL
jgi:hypothetical protein